MDFHDKIVNLAPINLFDYEEQIPELKAMHQCIQDPIWHAEGDVLTHTNMVMEKIFPIAKFCPNPDMGINLYLGALLHDIGKPNTTTIKTDTKRTKVTSHGHEGSGVSLARNFLRKYFPEFNTARREFIVSLVEFHGHPKRMIKDGSKDIAFKRLSLEVDLQSVYWVEKADFAGRISKSSEIPGAFLEDFKRKCEELDVWNQPYQIPGSGTVSMLEYNMLRWNILFNGLDPADENARKRIASLVKKTEAKPFELMIATGIPGSGKTTYIKRMYPTVKRISMDDERARLGNINDMSKNDQVFKSCFDDLCKSMKSSENVIWDATSLTRDNRKKLIDVARQHGAYVTILYFDIPLEVALSRNAKRDRNVPEQVIRNFYSRLQYPASYECDRLLVVDESPKFQI